mmetsp:Transcript_4079/g.12282  ORF Transcript_4079/g.12282 Transcript_4079/m.12282 type:complete len:201 (-) Transcript_4079:579-1181(-)
MLLRHPVALEHVLDRLRRLGRLGRRGCGLGGRRNGAGAPGGGPRSPEHIADRPPPRQPAPDLPEPPVPLLHGVLVWDRRGGHVAATLPPLALEARVVLVDLAHGGELGAVVRVHQDLPELLQRLGLLAQGLQLDHVSKGLVHGLDPRVHVTVLAHEVREGHEGLHQPVQPLVGRLHHVPPHVGGGLIHHLAHRRPHPLAE